MEIWKDIEEYEGRYHISNLGRVKSVERVIYKLDGKRQTVKERILRPAINSRGYYCVNLNMNGKGRTHMVHQLVANAFIQNTNNLPVINHIDGNKLNNKADNLEWTTQKKNIIHAWETGLASYKSHSRRVVDDNEIIDIRTRRKNGEKRKNVYSIYKEKIGESGFNDIWYNKNWKHISI